MAHLVGKEAERRLARFWQNTIYDLKTLLGATFEEVQKHKSRWGFKVVPGKKGLAYIEVESQGNTEILSPQQILAKVLSKLKETAEEAQHQKVTSACITVPVQMSDIAREALREAAGFAGFTEVHLISDPTAAVMAYDLDLPDSSGVMKDVMVVDFGASVNVTLVRVQAGLIRIVKSETADLTASAIERVLMNHFGEEFRRKTGLDYKESRRAVFKLLSECERVKKDLSQMPQSNVQCDGFHEGCDLNAGITRARFEALTDNLLKGILTPIHNITTFAGGIDKIHSVICTGGSTKIPKVQQYLKQYFSGSNVQILSSIDGLEVNARGAALYGSLLSLRNPMLKLKKGSVSTSLSIGISSHDGTFIPIIPKDSIVPIHVVKTFGVSDNQTQFLLSVYEGESKTAKENHLLGELLFAVDPKAPALKTFQVSFTLDPNGLLKITSQSTPKKETIKFEGVKTKLKSDNEIEKYLFNSTQ
uniref:Uncharacterized protein n=1 Tax=Arcella intermedia TaxID=1963864 RepID=A0A6B2L1X2_9EUKA